MDQYELSDSRKEICYIYIHSSHSLSTTTEPDNTVKIISNHVVLSSSLNKNMYCTELVATSFLVTLKIFMQSGIQVT